MSGAAASVGLNAAGWIFMVTACVGIAAATAYCFYKVFKTQDRGK